MKNLITYTLLILLLAVLFWSGFLFGKSYMEKHISNVIDSDTVNISIDVPEPDTIYIPKIIYNDTGSHTVEIKYNDTILYVPVPVEIDTAKIVADYLKVRNYEIDTIINEIKANIRTSIYANKMANMQLKFTNLKTCNQPKWQFKAGIMTGYNEISPTIILDKNKYSYLLGYDIIGNKKAIRAGFFYNF